jgi:hypothetical protein
VVSRATKASPWWCRIGIKESGFAILYITPGRPRETSIARASTAALAMISSRGEQLRLAAGSQNAGQRTPAQKPNSTSRSAKIIARAPFERREARQRPDEPDKCQRNAMDQGRRNRLGHPARHHVCGLNRESKAGRTQWASRRALSEDRGLHGRSRA